MPVRSESMPVSDSPLYVRLAAEHGEKAIRYCAVSVVNVVTGLSTLAFCHGVLHWSAVSANITAWMVSTVPAYMLSRAWVWKQSGSHRFGGEVLPFWILALVGLLFSTIVVDLVERHTERTIYILVGNLSAYGVVWVAKYLILDKVMWRHRPANDPVEVA
jgi:putative flippase GtrA